jgi:hypothetical protein
LKIAFDRSLRYLKKLNYQTAPSSDAKDGPPLWHHFANLLATGSRKSPEANKVVAVTGSLLDADGKASTTLVVTQNHSALWAYAERYDRRPGLII